MRFSADDCRFIRASMKGKDPEDANTPTSRELCEGAEGDRMFGTEKRTAQVLKHMA